MPPNRTVAARETRTATVWRGVADCGPRRMVGSPGLLLHGSDRSECCFTCSTGLGGDGRIGDPEQSFHRPAAQKSPSDVQRSRPFVEIVEDRQTRRAEELDCAEIDDHTDRFPELPVGECVESVCVADVDLASYVDPDEIRLDPLSTEFRTDDPLCGNIGPDRLSRPRGRAGIYLCGNSLRNCHSTSQHRKFQEARPTRQAQPVPDRNPPEPGVLPCSGLCAQPSAPTVVHEPRALNMSSVHFGHGADSRPGQGGWIGFAVSG